MSEAERLADDLVPLWDNGVFEREDAEEAAAELRRLTAENAALRKDAERHRWRRLGKPLTVKMKKATVVFGPNLEPDYSDALDSAIDEAMQKETP
jgi:hypothetical protein